VAARAAVPAVGAPPGRVLPVVEQRPERPNGRANPDAARNGRPAGEVVQVPVRQQAESARDGAAAAPLVPTAEGDFWHGLVGELVAREAVVALVRELALQSQLIARDVDHWILRVERESLNQPASRERLQAALKAAGHAVSLGVEVGTVTDSPARRNAAAAAEKLRVAEEAIRSDPFVQDMIRDFGAKIVPGSIKPL
jgi:DNA polymerase III subunit gamma/tau